MKKSNLFKRVLAVFISVMMVVTSIPFTAITASAATDPNLLAFYFNNSVPAKSVTTNYAGENAPALGTVSEDTLVWNYTENAAEFKGNKSETARVKLSDLLNGKTCNNSTGFTIQFDAKTNMTGWGNFFEISNSTPYNGTGGTGKTYVYLSASSNSGESNKCHSKVALTNGSESSSACSVAVNDNQWHNFRLVIGQGQLYIFVDGKLQSPGLNDSSRINDNLFNELKNNGYLNFGASAYSQSPAYTGYIRNFMFVNNAKLDIAMAKYENKMNGKAYTNMKPAYDAYVTAKKCAEALRYGDFESYPNIENYADDLNTKTDAMTEFTGYTANSISNSSKVFGDWDNATQDDYNAIYKNALYVQRGISANSNAALNKSNVYSPDKGYTFDFKFFYPETTFLYDGKTTPQVGAMFSCYGNTKPGTWGWGNMWLYAAYINNTSDISFDSKWKARDGRLNHSWVYRTKDDVNISGTGDTTSMYYNQAERKEYYYANIIKFNKTLSSTDALVMQYTPNFSTRSGYNGKNGANSKLNDLGAGNRKIYVFNYKKVIDSAKSKSTTLSDVANYTQGGLSSILDAIEKLQKNPNDYFSSSNNITGCESYFNSALTDLDNATATKDAFFTITAKKDTNAGDTLATFSLSNGCKAKTVQYALNTVTPGNGQADTYHYDYVWTSNAITDVKANATYVATQSKEDHKFVDVDVKTPATCENTGIMNTKCSVCDYASTRVINATGHNYSNFTKTWENYVDDSTVYQHKKTCSNANCDTPTVTVNCSFGEWVTNDAETEDSRTCSVCYGVQTREHKANQVTINFKRDGDVIVQSFTVDKGETVDAPASFTLYDVDGHHIYSYPQASYVANENADIPADRVDVAHTDVQTRKINLSNVDENGVATSCKEGLTYSYDLQTYCADCNTIISTVNTPVSALAHTETKQANGSRDNHNIYCTACNTVLRTEGHVFAETDVPSTCIAQGYTQSDCECGAQYKDDFKELAPHTFGDYVSNNDGTHTRTCSVCNFEQTATCNYSTVIIPATCTESAKQTSECNDCGYDAAVVDLGNAVEVNTLYDVTYISNGNSNSEKTFTLPDEANYMDVTINSYATDGTFSDSKLYVYGIKTAGGSEEEVYRNSGGKDQLSKTFRVYGNYFRVKTQDFTGTQDYYNIVSVKAVIKKYAAQGHKKQYIKNEDGLNGLLGTHRHECSVCHEGADETTEHNLDLQRDNNNSTIVVSCKDCDFSQVLHTTANTVTVTENNMFDTDKFFQSYTANATNTTSHGLACFRRTDGKAVVVGNGDNYTSHDRENDYLIPVKGGKTYQFDFDASTTYGDVMLFFRGAGVSYDTNYLSMRKSGTAIGKNTIEFTVPEGGKQLYIRIGTNSGDRNAYCVFSNFALHEKDDPNYRMITNVPMDSAINDYFTDFGTADVCHYEYKNSSISYADGAMATGTTFNRNVNVVKSANHDIYKEFSNGTVSHFYCVTCGYNYDKDVEINMVYRESFDNASVSGSTFTSSNGNGTLANSGTGSIVEYSGGQDKGALYSNVRHNVLKLNANATKPGNWMKLDTNPLTDPATAEKAKQDGITISFWRHMEKNGATANLASSGDPTGYNWRNALSFHQDGNSGNRYYIEVNGVQSRCAVEGQDYTDLVPYYNDNTTKGTPNYTGDWVNIVVTIDPTDKVNGGTLYINGVPREYDLTRTKGAGKYVLSDTMNPGDIAADVINFLTQSDTGFYFNNGNPWEGNDYDMFYDDVRIYTGVMTQLQINEMYGAQDSDTPSTNSITHDPTNVTVYTLKAGTYTAANGSGETYVAEAGKTVGEEFINYYGVDVATQVSNIEYYSFGTGMVIEKSSNGVDWTMVGDSKGHFAYQNEDLFGGKYTDVLSEPLNYAKQGASGGGYLLWAPHVMYNLTLNKWVIYESTSSWGSQFSTIFYCTSDTVYKDYAYQGMIMKTNSSSKCNAIDSDVYYGRDENGIVDKSKLYLAYGSYSWNGSNIAIWGRELTATGENKSGVDSTWSESVDYPCIKADGSSSEGIFVYYYEGYYYMFTTYGGNDNNYTEVYFRSENPNGPFVRADGVNATAGTGMFFQSSYKNPVETYTYWSNGHNSVYTVYNNNNEPVLVNAAHSRVLSDGTVQSEEGQIITNQTDIRGNLMISNMIATTKSGWMVMFPLQYNGTDTTKLHLTASDVVGTYDAINNTKSTSNGVAQATTMTITACDDTHLWINGTLFALEYDADKDVTYIVGDTLEGTFAKHNDTIEFSFFNKSTLQHTWGYQTAKGDAATATHDLKTVVTNEADVYTWTTTCSKCDFKETKVVDITAYNASVAAAQVEIGNKGKYTEDSRNVLATYIVELDLSTISTLTQDDVDGYNTALTTANNLVADGGVLVVAEYTVTFEYQVDDASTTVIDHQKFAYGTNIEMKIPDEVEGKVYKWSYEIGESTSKQAIDNRSITYIVAASEATIKAYIDSEKSASIGHTIKMYSKTGKLSDSVATSAEYYDITSMNIATITFYSITGYRINGTVVNTDDASLKNYRVDTDLEIQPIYSALGKEFTITPATDDILINDKPGAYKAAWDVKVTATAPDANAKTAWYVDDQLVGYGETYTFRATKSCTVRYENAQEIAGIASLDFLDYGVYRNHGITAVGHYDVPEDATDVKAGVILKTVKNPTDTTRQLTFEEITTGNTTGKKYASVFTDTDQYKIVVTRTANTAILIGAVAFVEYTINGESKVAYSAPQTIYGIN